MVDGLNKGRKSIDYLVSSRWKTDNLSNYGIEKNQFYKTGNPRDTTFMPAVKIFPRLVLEQITCDLQVIRFSFRH
jgi:hypothetical protein